MITVEAPLRSLQIQRKGLLEMLETRPEQQQFVLGAIAVLDWLEHGTETPVECLVLRTEGL